MPRPHLLHVLVPASLLTAVLSTFAPAVAAAPIPPPSVVCIDVGHGGDDPGALGLDGLVEKNLTLDISDRLAALLRADGATVVLTRTSDVTVSIAQRAATCIGAHADVMLAIYINAWYTSTPEGSVVLYPYARDIPFAKAIDQAVGADIAQFGDPDGGIVLRPNWWLTPPMPVATIEPLFCTNPHDAALLAQASVRQGLAEALRTGIESFLPAILARKDALATPTPLAQPRSGGAAGPLHTNPTARARPRTRSGPARAGTSGRPAATASSAGNPLGTLLLWLFLIAGAAFSFRYRRTLVPVLLGMGAFAARLIRDIAIRRNARRRRRRAVQGRAGARAEHATPGAARPAAAGRHMRRVRGEVPIVAVRGRRVDPLPLDGSRNTSRR
jgi:N-acetylmuramoyl-L-alanine amidase